MFGQVSAGKPDSPLCGDDSVPDPFKEYLMVLPDQLLSVADEPASGLTKWTGSTVAIAKA